MADTTEPRSQWTGNLRASWRSVNHELCRSADIAHACRSSRSAILSFGRAESPDTACLFALESSGLQSERSDLGRICLQAKLTSAVFAYGQNFLYSDGHGASVPRRPGRIGPGPKNGVRRRPPAGRQDDTGPLAPWGSRRISELGVAEHRERILRRRLPPGTLWFFDEIHKYRTWRNYLKGLYDGRARGQRILVTGSARLDWHRFSGDSLQGRHHLLRLHPLSVAELGITRTEDFTQLLRLGGFPEPFYSGSEVEARRWSREYRSLLVREEVVALERVQDLGNLELLALRLPDLVGSLLSLNALREDLQVSHKALNS